MNNSYNYADFIGMSLTSDDEFEPYGYQQELQTVQTFTQEPGIDTGIEHILFSNHKLHNFFD